ncbi:hypothetical protein ACSDR0_39820 [Streptosporangium sp. G11]|uniref:hypothetical protein n=1 Tax=Streptosporangium sp. G11 TaxID=3436926 RepID=UPI003EBCE777
MSLFITVVAGLAAILGAAVGDLLSKEMEGQLGKIPYILLGIARRRLPENMRESLHDDEWHPELVVILREEETRPISRLVVGTRYSLGLIRRAHLIASIRDQKTTFVSDHRRWLTVVDVLRIAADLSVLVAGVIASGGAGVLLGLLIPQILSIGAQNGPGLGVLLGTILTLVFGTTLGVGIGLVLNSGLGRITRRMLVTRIDRSKSSTHAKPKGRARVQAALNAFAGAHLDNKWGVRVAAFFGSLVGVGLGILTGLSFPTAWEALILGVGSVSSLMILRIPLVVIPEWWLKRLSKRL